MIEFLLLSGIRPANQMSAFTSQHIPGVTLTTCNFDGSFDGSIWPESRRVGSPRCWPHDSHSSDHSDQSGNCSLVSKKTIKKNWFHINTDFPVSLDAGGHRDSDQSGHSGEHRDSGIVKKY